jgi:hypothetical protein
MRKRLLALVVGLGLAAAVVGAVPGTHAQRAHAFGLADMNRIQRHILSGLAAFELTRGLKINSPQAASVDVGGSGSGSGDGDRGQDGPDGGTAVPSGQAGGSGGPGGVSNYTPHDSNGCSDHFASNQKVNQNCLNISDPNLQGRAQAQNETSISGDPNHHDHLIASYNDYRRGDGTCGASYSTDNGSHWADATTPNGFTSGAAFGAARQYWQAGGDTSVAWDTKGNAYLSCQVFMRGAPTSSNPDLSSAFYVFRSTQNNGASFNFTGRPVIESADTSGSGTPPFED